MAIAPSQPFFASAAFNGTLWIATIRGQGFWRYLLRLSINGPKNVGSVFTLYLDGIDPSRLIDTTARGDLNTNQYEPHEPIPPGSSLVGTWTGASSLPVNMTAYISRDS